MFIIGLVFFSICYSNCASKKLDANFFNPTSFSLFFLLSYKVNIEINNRKIKDFKCNNNEQFIIFCIHEFKKNFIVVQWRRCNYLWWRNLSLWVEQGLAGVAVRGRSRFLWLHRQCSFVPSQGLLDKLLSHLLLRK